MLFFKNWQNFRVSVLQNAFVKSVVMLSSGTVIAQVINFLGLPFVTRLYDPEALGIFTLVSTNAGLVSIAANLGMMLSFLLPREDGEARALSRLVMVATTFLAGVVIAILYFCQEHYKIINISYSSYTVMLGLVFVYIIVNTVNGICYAYINRRKLYKVMFWNPIIYTTVNILLCIILGNSKADVTNYIIASIAAFCVAVLQMCCYANPFSDYDTEQYKLKSLLLKYKSFPLLQMPADLISGIGRQIPLQTMEITFSATVLGLWSMALKIMSLPINFLAVPINRVYFQEASQRYARGEKIGEFALDIIETNIKLAIVPVLLVVGYGDCIFSFVLGAKWEEAGLLAGLIAAGQLMEFVNNCISGSFVIIKKNSWNVISGIAFVGIGLFLWGICKYYPTISLGWFLIIMSALFALRTVISIGVLFFVTGADMRRYTLFIIKYIVSAFMITILAGIMKGSLKW